MPARRVLITSGATREPIDGVRFISNVSTGATGARLAEILARAGYEITYLHGRGALCPDVTVPCEREEFGEFRELDEALRRRLEGGRYFAVLQAAAVSDYSVASVRLPGREITASGSGKLTSDEEIELVLRRNFKIVERLKAYSGGRTRVVAFKLTNTSEVAEIRAALAKLAASGSLGGSPGNIDAIAHNDLGAIRRAREAGQEHEFGLFRVEGGKLAGDPNICAGPEGLARALTEEWKS